MSEIKPREIYKVTITEYERGYGQRVDPKDTKFFDNFKEAKEYADKWEKGNNHDYFFKADIRKIS